MKIAASAIIYPNVILDDDIIIEDFCIIGYPHSSGGNLPTKIGRGSIIRSHTVIYGGNTIGSNFQTGNKANIRENNTIGDNVSIGTLSVIEHSVKIGNNVRIHSQVFIPEFSTLEDHCWIGPNAVLTNAKYPQSKNIKKNLVGPHIKKHVIVGANSTILPGIVLEEKTLIGAGSVVINNTQSSSVYAGNPAKFIKKIKEINAYDTDTTLRS